MKFCCFYFSLSCSVGVYVNLCDATVGYTDSDSPVLRISWQLTFLCFDFGRTYLCSNTEKESVPLSYISYMSVGRPMSQSIGSRISNCCYSFTIRIIFLDFVHNLNFTFNTLQRRKLQILPVCFIHHHQ
jgi:hypothetical protein